MRFATTLVLALAAETALASSWFTKAPYNKWHETELERWLSDHSIPYPTPADRKDLQNLVKENWQSAVESPYANWDTQRLQNYLSAQGTEAKKGAENNKDALVDQVKSSWKDTASDTHSVYGDVKDYVFDSWTESSLKAFCDKHGIPVPQPRKRDQALSAAREGYQTAAEKVGETAAYPGNWLYESWTDSDLKSWLDERGIPSPPHNKRDKMVAEVRRNAYLARSSGAAFIDYATSSGASYASSASSKGSNYASSASSMGSNYASSASSMGSNYASTASNTVSSAAASISASALDALYDTWSDSQLKEFADKNGIKVPQGSKRNEVLAVLRKNAAKLTGDNLSASAASAYGAATSMAGNQYARATDDASLKAGDYYGSASSYANHYYTEAMIALGFQNNYASTASASVSSVYAKATNAAKAEL